MIKGYCKIGDTDRAMAMLISLLKGTPTATLVTYNTIIKGYCDSGNTSAALKILELMEANGCEPDEWSYNELIAGFCNVGEMESASRLFSEMVGRGLRPDEVTYNTLISGYCTDEKLDRAAEMLERMKESGCRPTVRTYNALIHALTKQNNFSAAERLCEVMLEEKISPNVVTYNTMIDGLCRNGATSLALEMLNRMVENSCLPDLRTYSSLIQALGQEGKVEEAEKLFSDLLRQGHTLDEVAYIKMIEVYIISGKVDRAFDLLGQMINAGCQPTLWTYDVLIKGLKNEHLMGDQKLVSLHDSVSNCSFDDQAIKEYAISVLSSKLADVDLGLSRQLNDAFLSGLSRSGRWYEAYKLYRSMVGQGLCPNQEAYNYFIISILRARKVDLAMGVFRHMSAQRCKLHLVRYKALICALCQFNRRKEAQFIFEHMLSRPFDPDNIVWTVLIDGLLGAGYKDLCMEYLHIMENNHREPSFRSYNILAREALKKQPSLGSVGPDAHQ
jgi:pentatricopeptide repeat protein